MRRALVLACAATAAVVACHARHRSAPPEGPSTAGSRAAVSSASTASLSAASAPRRTDNIVTSKEELSITPIYHASILFRWQGKAIYVDPWSKGNFAGLPKADLVLLTDVHPDHLDPAGLATVKQPSTIVVGPPAVAAKTSVGVVLANGQSKTVNDIGIEAVPMYNLERGPSPGKLYHDKGRGNGYVLTFADQRVYVSGDTECTPEMKALKHIDVAFVCMNLPYTMPPEEAAECIAAFAPRIVYPYHYRGSDVSGLATLLKQKGYKGSDVRLRNWYPN